MSADSSPTDFGSNVTRIIDGVERPWITVPGVAGVSIKVLVADEVANRVVFMFRFAPGTVLPPHKHLCHAIAYTIAGEWRYEEGVLGEGSVAYEPFGSEHTASSEKGAELVVFLQSETGQFLENIMAPGVVFPMDMNFFKLLETITPEQAANLQIPGLTS